MPDLSVVRDNTPPDPLQPLLDLHERIISKQRLRLAKHAAPYDELADQLRSSVPYTPRHLDEGAS